MVSRSFLFLACPAVLLCCFLDHAAARWGFALLTTALPVSLIALAASRPGRFPGLGPLRGPLVFLLLVLEGSVVALLLLSQGQGSGLVLFAGIPLSLWILLGGLWLVPLALVAWTYTAHFASFELRDEDLERLRQRSQVPGTVE